MAAALCTLAFIYVASSRVSSLTEVNDRIDHEQALSAKVENSLLLAVANLRGFAMTKDPAEAAAFKRNMASFHAAVNELRPLLKEPDDAQLLEKTVAEAERWERQDATPILAQMSSAERTRADDLLRRAQGSATVRNLVAGAETLRKQKYDAVQGSLEKMHKAAVAEEWAVWVGAIVMIAVAMGLWRLLCGLLGQPVVKLTEVMRTLAGGNNNVDVPDAERGDELGSMAKAVLVFRDTAQAKEAADKAKAKADAEQLMVVDTLKDRLGRIADGDLTASIDADFPTDYREVKENFNKALASLCELIGTVIYSSATIRGSSGEVADASEDLARRTETNAASLEQTSAALSQMNDRVKATANAAGGTAQSAGDALTAVESGRGVTDGAVTAMARVAEQAKGIDDVIEGLDKIAFQTRVLAMNAAVEAGRAGEAGQGFAVVADLVSALAMRAEEEASRAREQLSATREEIGSAVDAVQHVDDALKSICDGVNNVHRLVASIAQDNQAQADAVNEISDVIEQMGHSTQQNAAMVEESSAAARTLAGEVAVLADQTARFTIPSKRTQPRRAAARNMDAPAMAAAH
ncbi:HAMP domain-containing protein [Stakelama sp. CBK3Z-3]|uniref:HAMP domain-containing protein n=2 Tax=Stakelama flava TaxID=2860338 RepID=A0ABS6XGN0_9SPHN|nr:HAMP domain-containing protein [Stakelama flava]